VCPTDALLPLSIEGKKVNQMGIVQLQLENCIVYTDEKLCGKCADICPTQAVQLVPYKNYLETPDIIQDICVGCGACEYVCPSKPVKAIFVEGITKHQTVRLNEVEVIKQETEDFGF
jgi:ferredoxin